MMKTIGALTFLILIASCGTRTLPTDSTSPGTVQPFRFNSIRRAHFPVALECVAAKNPTALGSSPGQTINLSNAVTDSQWNNPQEMGAYARVFESYYDLIVQHGCLRG